MDLSRERQLVEEARAAVGVIDLTAARTKAGEAIDLLLARPANERNAGWLKLLADVGLVAWDAQDPRAAKAAWEVILDVRSRTLPDDHPDLQWVRGSLANSLYTLGDLATSRALQEKVLDVLSLTLPEDHLDLQVARMSLANTLYTLGALGAARKLFEQVVEVYSRTLPEDHPKLQGVRMNLALTMNSLGDLHGAKALFEQVLEVQSRTAPEDDLALQKTRLNFAITLNSLGDLQGARALEERVLEVFSRTLPKDHPDLQAARGDLAITLHKLGDLHRARALFEQVLEVQSRTLPGDHPNLQESRLNLAITSKSLGDLHGARTLFEQVLEVLSRTLPEDHPNLLRVQINLATTIRDLGDLQGARALEERVLEIGSRTLPEEHPELQGTRSEHAMTLSLLGDLHGSRALLDQVLAIQSRTLPDDHLELQKTRLNLASVLYRLGDLQGARRLQEQVLEIRLRTLPSDHSALQATRNNLALTIRVLGDLHGARALQEDVLEVNLRTLPPDHPTLQRSRQNLAGTMRDLGDLQGARALFEMVLEVSSRTLPADHPSLQLTRLGLASTIRGLGDLQGARALEEQVLEVYSRTLPEDHPDLQRARQGLAITLDSLGDLQGARALDQQVLEVFSRTLSDDHPALQAARQNLACTMQELGDLNGARALQESVLEVNSRTLPDDHPDLQAARGNLALTLAHQLARVPRSGNEGGENEEERDALRTRCAELVGALCLSQTSAARTALLGGSAREAEMRCETLSASLDASLSYAGGLRAFEPIPALERVCFVLSETTRGAALSSAALTRRAAGTPRYSELREELRHRSAKLADLVQKGATSENFYRALASREEVEQGLATLARELSGGNAVGLDIDVAALAAGLGERDVVVAYRRYKLWTIARVGERDGKKSEESSMIEPSTETSVDSLCAFILRSRIEDSTESAGRALVTRVELGAIEPIEQAVRAWRASLGDGAEARGVGIGSPSGVASRTEDRARELRRLVFDPLEESLRGADHAVFVLDDVLHLVPLDALPAEDLPISVREPSLLGDRLRIETRVTVTELLATAEKCAGRGDLVAVGGVEYGASALDRKPEGTPAESAASTASLPPKRVGVRLGANSEVGEAGEVSATRAGLDTEDRPATNDGEWPEDERSGILRHGPWARGFEELPGTREEARAIAREFEGLYGTDAGLTHLEGCEATREKLIAFVPKARWLHVATHGWFASESIHSWKDPEPLDKHSGLGQRLSGGEQVKGMSPMLLCGLALAGANLPEDELGRVPGLITADEIAALDLSNCELAVLSACDTNVGERRSGQGVASLQKALHMAGARSVITSLWKVPDEATKELMLDFYRRIWVEKKPKWQALWEAKRKIRDAKDEAGKPRYSTRDWAAWVLTGDPN